MLDWLEGQHQAEKNGCRHVDPEDLQRCDRQGGAGENRGNDDQALTEIGR
jgi:hypothetical protein